jgi:hypothetical protein
VFHENFRLCTSLLYTVDAATGQKGTAGPSSANGSREYRFPFRGPEDGATRQFLGRNQIHHAPQAWRADTCPRKPQEDVAADVDAAVVPSL